VELHWRPLVQVQFFNLAIVFDTNAITCESLNHYHGRSNTQMPHVGNEIDLRTSKKNL
jgi:hypothetical protein